MPRVTVLRVYYLKVVINSGGATLVGHAATELWHRNAREIFSNPFTVSAIVEFVVGVALLLGARCFVARWRQLRGQNKSNR